MRAPSSWSIPLTISINGRERFALRAPPLRIRMEAMPGLRPGSVDITVELRGEKRVRAWMARLAGVLAFGERVLGWRVEVTAG